MTNITLNVPEMVDFLVGLLETPSPTGDTDRAVTYVQDALADFPLDLRVTPKGILTATWLGRDHTHPRAITSHLDTLGCMVQEIKANGRLRLTAIGGIQWGSLEGEGCTVFTAEGQTIRGSIMPVNASVHATTAAERNKPRTDQNMELRLDARTQSRKDSAELGIQVGDFVAIDPRVEVSDSGFIRSRFLDDKASVACVVGAIAALHAAGLQPAQTTTFHFSNFEEVGHGAAAGLPTDLYELLTVDMAVVAPKQTSNEFAVTICAKDSRGPYHLGFRRELEALAAANNLTTAIDIYPYYGSDGGAFWRAGGRIRAGGPTCLGRSSAFPPACARIPPDPVAVSARDGSPEAG